MINKFPWLKILLIGLFFIPVQEILARSVEIEEDNTMLLTDFLDDLSAIHEVFFTYKTEALVKVSLNPEEYNYKKLKRVISKLEKDTRLNFEYLGNRYYVVYDANEQVQMELASLPILLDESLDNKMMPQTITGTVTDNTGSPIPGVNVLEKGTTNGVTTDFDGNYSIDVSEGATLVFSYIGYSSNEVAVNGQNVINVTLQDGVSLDELVIVGNRAKPRTILESPVPIDNISAKELSVSGQLEVDKMLTYRVPSFNSTNQTVSDATAHFDPSELRNLGPSRTLVLVNGKRKNQSALVYVNETPGRGEVGVDFKSIPASAIERVEVLRDGASAQYGSDAIAGVINIILKEKSDKTRINLSTGVTTEGDGFTYSGDINKTFNLKNNAYINVTGEFYHQDFTDRAGEPGNDLLFGNIFGDQTLLDGTNPFIQENPDLGMIVGQPEYDKLGLSINAGFPYANGDGKFYVFGTLQDRDGTSFALYRAPYWITTDFGLLTPAGEDYNGFQPTFETDIVDNTFSVGNQWKMFNDWNFDVSYTYGRNKVDYTIGNSINVSLGANSPTEFDPGGYSFNTNIGNLDVSKDFGNVVFTVGTEIRGERFITREGEEASYIDGGVQSFPGLRPENALEETRSNVGVYSGVDWDINEAFLLSSAVRYENYSDFGDNLSWKLSGRYLLNERKGAIRASINTGFRAPSLHQIYLSNIQTLQLADGSIGQQGTFNNVDPVIIDPVNGLGVPSLDAEESFNVSAGFTYRFTPRFSVSLDYYNIQVDNRVLLTNPLGFDGDDNTVNAVEQVLIDNGIGNVTFFVNAADTNTQGIDLVSSYDNIPIGNGNLDINFAFNWNKTDLDGTIDVPEKIFNAGYTDIFNREEQARITTARPNLKSVVGLSYEINKLNVNLNNTYFGEVTFRHPTTPGFDQTFAGKLVTDFSASYKLSDVISARVLVNNLFNVFPDEIETFGDFGTDLGGRFRYPWEVNQFGFNGTFIQGGLTFQF